MEQGKLPVLMYHEVIEQPCPELQTVHKMTPAYTISKEAFEEQIKYLSKAGYETVTFADQEFIGQHPERKYVVLTFDDGWLGNFTAAWPILKKYGFKAVFFVTCQFIGQPDFMKWQHLHELSDSGMLVQPHGMSHKPMQNLNEKDLKYELLNSKEIIERKLHVDVFSMSFPHGSYDRDILEVASGVGYKIMCTSELERTYCNDLLSRPSVVGRIAITRKMQLDEFGKFINYDKQIYFKYGLFHKAKKYIKLIIGIENYRKLYRAYYSIDNPD